MRLGLIAFFLTSNALGATQIPEEVTKVRDPFKKPVSRFSTEKPRSPLELYPVDKFKVVGIVTGPRKLRAMLLGPDGKSYFIAEGTSIGVRKGVVRKITHTGVLVRERVLNVLGQEENVDSEMKLPEEGNNVGTINAPIVDKRFGNDRDNRGGGPGGGGNFQGGGGPGGGNEPNAVGGGNQPAPPVPNPGAPIQPTNNDSGPGNSVGAGAPAGSGGSNRQGGSG